MSTDPFVVHVADLRRFIGASKREVRSGFVDPYEGAPPAGPGDSSIPEGQLVICDVELQAFIGGVMATGTVSAVWRGTCRRCTAPVGGELRAQVRERFVDRAEMVGDDEAYAMVDDRLNLRPMVHDAVALELPAAPLCREDCRGLCRRCGADLNEEDCECVATPDPRWASLDVLRTARRG